MNAAQPDSLRPDAQPSDGPALEAMAVLTEKLTGLIEVQALAFERHRPQDAAATLAEVARLANLYRAGSADVRAAAAKLGEAPAELRARLLSATEAFEAALERQSRALAASKVITVGVVKAIADEIAARRGVGQAYGPGPRRRGSATAITLDRQA